MVLVSARPCRHQSPLPARPCVATAPPHVVARRKRLLSFGSGIGTVIGSGFRVAGAVAAEEMTQHRDMNASSSAAAVAASYWRGGRVRAHDEPILPTPDFGPNGTVDYHGQPQVQEAMEYYMDKFYEGRVTDQLMSRLQALEDEASSRVPRPAPPSSAGVDGTIWGAGDPRGLVAYLLMENADRTVHRDLLLSLHCLGQFFGRYPVAVFYTNETTPTELVRLREASPSGLRLFFEEVHIDFPASMADVPGGPDAFLAPPRCMIDGQHYWSSHQSCGCRCPAWRPQCWPLNWMHATRFFTADMFRTRIFQRLDIDFFMRLDTDLFFAGAPDVDPFRLMAQHGCALVYDRLSREAPGCFDGFDDRTLQLIRRLGYAGRPDQDMLYVGRGPAAAGGQWTIGDARLFRSDAYLTFADWAASGIYANRWADQLILVRGVALFGPRAGTANPEWISTAVRAGAAPPPAPPPPLSICVRSLFAVESGARFVHQKGGFRDNKLLQVCGADPAVLLGDESLSA